MSVSEREGYNIMSVDVPTHMKEIFEELCKGNISVLTLENRMFLADISSNFGRPDYIYDDFSLEALKYLIMICNLLYNRTSMDVLPVEDGVYDILLEKYKSFDPNFQVGSAVVDFKENLSLALMKEGKTIAKRPFEFLEPPKQNEIGMEFRKELMDFDVYDVLAREEFYMKEPEITPDMYRISKRTHDTEHNHPDLVGTLDKCKFIMDADAVAADCYNDPRVTILERDFFRRHIELGLYDESTELELVLELKYDGISVEADCCDIVTSARTRGDTGIGQAADITPILYGYPFPRNKSLAKRNVGVKFEAIIKKSDQMRFNVERGYNYANCRTAIIGLFGSSDALKYRDYITLVPLALDRNDVPEVKNRMEEIELLNKLYKTHGEPLRYCYIKGNYKECLYQIKIFAEEAEFARSYMDFMFDGIVISYLDENLRQALGRQNYINKYSVALKFNPLSKLTTFMGYTYSVGYSGNICPMIHYAPVEFIGTIHEKSTGSSYARFQKLNLRPGDIIRVTYTNDVMVYVDKFDCEQNQQNTAPPCEFPTVCPVCGTPLIFTKMKAICPNTACPARNVERMTNVLQRLNIKGFAQSTILQLDKYTIRDLLSIDTEEAIAKLGPADGVKLCNAVDDVLERDIEDYKWMNAIGFSDIGPAKWSAIFKTYTMKEFVEAMDGPDRELVSMNIMNIPNLGPSTASTVMSEYDMYAPDIHFILEKARVIDTKNLSTGKVIRFSGCRNRDLEVSLIRQGYDCSGDAGVTKRTDILLIPYAGYTSSKTQKVSEDCQVIPIDQFLLDPKLYL